MSGRSHHRGRAAEAEAQQALAAAGFRILESNYRVLGSELDVVCRDADGIVFAEVRARSDHAVDPSATLGGRKLHRMLRGARTWLLRHRMSQVSWRFVVVAVTLDAEGRPVGTEIIEDPFAHMPEYHRGDP